MSKGSITAFQCKVGSMLWNSMLIIIGRGTQCLLGQVLVLYLHHFCAPVSVHTRFANQGYEREGELRFRPPPQCACRTRHPCLALLLLLQPPPPHTRCRYCIHSASPLAQTAGRSVSGVVAVTKHIVPSGRSLRDHRARPNAVPLSPDGISPSQAMYGPCPAVQQSQR